ncbi:hypothetical protein [Asanoa iriomotensis]|uniref:Metallo-beta-lactamase superfamily protein n=1 Tax=Asanoa iriomotensis TaxID=234613 RepID=A0ABQ4BXS8_9ACTN|nr:hypothetical protein [Asanoa iriomotensis]GIF55337.1 hypothetical protein Air01nite_14320 [Asanoa iriomotensis]
MPLGHSDTDHTTALFAPSIGLAVAGDSVYNGVHLYLAEAGDGGLDGWFGALDTIDDLRPRAVVSGHKAPGTGDSPADVDATRDYLRDWAVAVRESGDARALYDTMIARYPDRINRAVVWHSAEAAKP